MNATDLEEAASDLVCNENIEAFAVSFVWSCRNAHHEQQAIKKLNELYPNIPAFSGVALLPILREYERTSAAALNAFVQMLSMESTSLNPSSPHWDSRCRCY